MSDIPRQAPPEAIRCRGRKRITGERCHLPAAEGSEFSPYHGGRHPTKQRGCAQGNAERLPAPATARRRATPTP